MALYYSAVSAPSKFLPGWRFYNWNGFCG